MEKNLWRFIKAEMLIYKISHEQMTWSGSLLLMQYLCISPHPIHPYSHLPFDLCAYLHTEQGTCLKVDLTHLIILSQDLMIWARLALNSQSSCLILPSGWDESCTIMPSRRGFRNNICKQTIISHSLTYEEYDKYHWFIMYCEWGKKEITASSDATQKDKCGSNLILPKRKW